MCREDFNMTLGLYANCSCHQWYKQKVSWKSHGLWDFHGTILCIIDEWPWFAILCVSQLTHWGRVTHICVSELPITGSDNGLSPGRRQAIIWTNAGILLIRTLGINFSGILSEIHTFSFNKMYLKMSSGKRRSFCLGLNVLVTGKRTHVILCYSTDNEQSNNPSTCKTHVEKMG